MKNMRVKGLFLAVFLIILLSGVVVGDSLNASQDAYTEDATGDTNYGGEVQIKTQRSDTKERDGYVQFNLGGATSVSRANISFIPIGLVDSNAQIDFYYCDDVFDEDTLTWNNAGTEVTNCDGSAFESVDLSSWAVDSWSVVNVTSKVNSDADGEFTIKIDITGATGQELRWYSKEDNIVNSTLINWTASGAAITGIVDLLFTNESGPYKASFDEGEDFLIYANYTYSNGSVVDDGECNITLYDGLYEVEASDDNFTLCSSCDYQEFKEQADLHDVTNAVNDSIHFWACHTQSPTGGITANISCQAGNAVLNVSGPEFPLCSQGLGFVKVSHPLCVGSQYVNFSVAHLSPPSQSIIVQDLAIDREFSIHLNEWGEDVFYNLTSLLYYVDHEHEYYEHGYHNVTANCSGSQDVYDYSVTEQLSIVNVLPEVFLQGILINDTEYNFSSPFQFKFYSPWIFDVAIVDDDLVFVNVTLYNGSGIIESSTNISFPPLQINSSEFQDFDANPFNLSVYACDGEGCTFGMAQFNVTDTPAPICLGLDNLTVENDTLYTWGVDCYDESFFSFMLNCSDGYGYFIEGLFTDHYVFNGSHTFIGDSNCTAEAWDGHTASLFDTQARVRGKVLDVESDGKINSFSVITSQESSTISYVKEEDRIRPIVDYNEPDSKVRTIKTFHFSTSPEAFYLPESRYKGHVVDFGNKIWFDAELRNDPRAPVEVYRVNLTEWRIDVYTYRNRLEFDSIGALNPSYYNFTVDVELPYPGLSFFSDFDSFTEALTFFFLALLWLVLLTLTAVLRGPSNQRIQLLNLGMLFSGIVLGVQIWQKSGVLGFVVVAISLGLFYGFAVGSQ